MVVVVVLSVRHNFSKIIIWQGQRSSRHHCLMVVSFTPRHMATYHRNLAPAELTLLQFSVAVLCSVRLSSVAFILTIALKSMACATPKGECCCCDWVSNVHKHNDMEVIANQNQPLSQRQQTTIKCMTCCWVCWVKLRWVHQKNWREIVACTCPKGQSVPYTQQPHNSHKYTIQHLPTGLTHTYGSEFGIKLATQPQLL